MSTHNIFTDSRYNGSIQAAFGLNPSRTHSAHRLWELVNRMPRSATRARLSNGTHSYLIAIERDEAGAVRAVDLYRAKYRGQAYARVEYKDGPFGVSPEVIDARRDVFGQTPAHVGTFKRVLDRAAHATKFEVL